MRNGAFSCRIALHVDDSERRRWIDALGPPRAAINRERLIYLICGVVWEIMAFLRMNVHHRVLASSDLALAAGSALLGIFYIVRAMFPRRASIVAGKSLSVEIDDGAITVRGDARATIRWASVERIVDVGDAFVVQRRRHRPAIPIPKRDFTDGGSGLWSFFELRLLGERMLSRRDHAAPIVNSMNAPFFSRVR